MTNPIGRRRTIGGLIALAVSACTRSSTDQPPDDAGSTTSTEASSQPPDAPTSAPPPPSTQPPNSVNETAPGEAPTAGLTVDPFGHGVASGDPDTSSVVLWTRLSGTVDGRAVPLLAEVSTSDTFESVLVAEVVEALAEEAHTVRVIASGFAPGQRLFYRFRVDDFVSPTGTTRTVRAAGEGDDAGPVRLAVSSCQLLETGHFAAHRDIAEADVDLVVWLGDFIYEGGGSSQLEGRAHTGGEANNLDDYRARYAQYLSDPQLQAARGAHPWVATWDDHEVANDYRADVDVERRTAAYRAWWEHVPTRLPAPTNDGLRIHRTIDLGPAGRVVLIDIRQYATGPGASEPTLLGAEQRAWLRSELERPHTGWTVLASPTLVTGLSASLSGAEPLLTYTFSSYENERIELLELLADQDSMIVSGDLHAGITLDAKADLFAPESTSAAPEFMAPAISSAFPERYEAAAPLLPLLNNHVRFIDTTNGWLMIELGARAVADYRFVDDVTDPDSAVSTRAGFVVDPGDPVPRPR